MLFKKAVFYTIDFSTLNIDELIKAMPGHIFQPCSPEQAISVGFSAVIEDDGVRELLLNAHGNYYANVRVESKKVKPAAINRELAKRLKECDPEERFSRPERDAIKSDIEVEFTRRAIPDMIDIPFIITRKGLVIVHASSYIQAEHVPTLLRKALGSFKAIAVSFDDLGVKLKTSMVEHLSYFERVAYRLRHGDTVSAVSEGGQSVRFKGYSLHDEDLLNHIEHSDAVKTLELIWNNGPHQSDIESAGVRADSRMDVEVTINDASVFSKISLGSLYDAGESDDRRSALVNDVVLVARTIEDVYADVSAMFGDMSAEVETDDEVRPGNVIQMFG